MVISSYVIDTLPHDCETVINALGAYTEVEVHGHENNRIVITIEADSLDHTYELATTLSQINGVLTTSLVYCNFEDEALCD